METKRCLEALEKVLSSRYSTKEYKIGGYQEWSVCLEEDGSGWTVYSGERGNRYNEVKCDTVLMACLTFIRKMTHNIEDVAKMENELLKFISEAA